jgi:hypothetical protein
VARGEGHLGKGGRIPRAHDDASMMMRKGGGLMMRKGSW